MIYYFSARISFEIQSDILGKNLFLRHLECTIYTYTYNPEGSLVWTSLTLAGTYSCTSDYIYVLKQKTLSI